MCDIDRLYSRLCALATARAPRITSTSLGVVVEWAVYGTRLGHPLPRMIRMRTLTEAVRAAHDIACAAEGRGADTMTDLPAIVDESLPTGTRVQVREDVAWSGPRTGTVVDIRSSLRGVQFDGDPAQTDFLEAELGALLPVDQCCEVPDCQAPACARGC
jgi:hypothetical protein